MGAWGAGSFENDDAMDFAAEIESAEDLAKALVLRGPEDPIEAPDACRIIVVAECVAAMRGHWHKDFPADLAAKVATFGLPSQSLFLHASDQLMAATSHGELVELWIEAGPREFNRAAHDLIERLRRPPATGAKAKKPRKKKPVFNRSPCHFCGEEMGEEQFSQFTIHLDHGDGLPPYGRGGFAHHACLNAALHPRFRVTIVPDDPDLSIDQWKAIMDAGPQA